MDKSVKGGLKSIQNIMTVRKQPPENREELQKFPLNLGSFMQPSPGLQALMRMERLSQLIVLEPKQKLSVKPILTDTNNTKDQLELEANTRN